MWFSLFAQYRYASHWDLFVIFIGVVCTLLKSLALPWTIIVYGEFAALLVDRSYGIGTSSPTILHKWFGGGRILYDNRNFVPLMTNNNSLNYIILERMQRSKKTIEKSLMIRLPTEFSHYWLLYGNLCLEYLALIASIEQLFGK